MNNITKKQAIIIWFLFSNILLFACLMYIGLEAKNKVEDATIALLSGILVNLLTLMVDVTYLFQDKLTDSISIEKNLNHLVHIINRNKRLKQELNELISNFSYIHDDEIGLLAAPPFVKDVFREESTNKLSELNDQLGKLKIGEISFSHAHCLQATMACMEKTKNKIFAISYPDVYFWFDDGQSYLDENKKTIVDRRVEIIRFFVVRNNETDQEILRNPIKKEKFIKILENQISINKTPKVKGRIRVFITDDRLHNYRQIADNMVKLPDISTYDDAVVSEWKARADGNKIDQSVLSFSRASLETAKSIENYLLKNARSKAFEITSPEMAADAVESLIKKINEI